MLKPSQWMTIESSGLYCKPGKIFIDPLYPVETAVITHAHADHARSGHQTVIASPETLAIMAVRYGNNFAQHKQALKYGEKIHAADIAVTLHPAGHILGSAQVLIEYKKSRVVISGDYKRAPDLTCSLLTPIPCDVFITEATFGLPYFQHPPIESEVEKLLNSLQAYPGRCHLIGAYALGKCQRLILEIRKAGYDCPIYLHGAMIKLCELYQTLGFNLGKLETVTANNAKLLGGKIVICPPSALHDRWSRRLPQVLTAMASGWMQIRARAKQKGIELPLIISDHADWAQLTTTIKEVNAPEIWITHGNEEALLYDCIKKGYRAKALSFLKSAPTEKNLD